MIAQWLSVPNFAIEILLQPQENTGLIIDHKR